MSFDSLMFEVHRCKSRSNTFPSGSTLPLYRPSWIHGWRSAAHSKWPIHVSRQTLIKLLLITVGFVVVAKLRASSVKAPLISVYQQDESVVYTDDPFIIPSIPGTAGHTKQKTFNKAPADMHSDLETFTRKAPSVVMSKDQKGEAPELTSPQPSTKAVKFRTTSGTQSPRIVLVMSLDMEDNLLKDRKDRIDRIEWLLENRREYAEAHGYGLYVRYANDFRYDYLESYQRKSSWSKVPICRAALNAFPQAEWFWFLDESAIIMSPTIELFENVIDLEAMETRIMRGAPIVRASSSVKSYLRNPVQNVRLIMAQDEMGVSPKSMVFANDAVVKAFFELWNDLQYRTYPNFEHAEASALNHIFQWHPTFLSRLALMPGNLIASQSVSNIDSLLYTNGDLVVMFDCELDPDCDSNFGLFWKGRKRISQAQS